MPLVKKVIVSVLLAVLLGCAGVGQKTGEFIDDSTITTKVKTSLFNDPVTSGWKIAVSTENGVVTLVGSVNTGKERDRATEIARAVAGVKSVKNHLVVK